MDSVVIVIVLFAAVTALIGYNVYHLIVKRPLEREWTQVLAPDPDASYRAILTYYPLKAGQRTSRVLSYVRLVQRRLDRTEGLIGYAFRANFYRQQLWTLSIWTDQASLREFMDDVIHQQASEDLSSYIERAEIRQWEVLGRDVPPSWEDALAHLEDPPAETITQPERDTSNVG